MSRFGFVGPSYTSQSGAVSDEECINLFAETNSAGDSASPRSYYGTPGLTVFAALPASPVRGSILANGRLLVVADSQLYEVQGDGTYTALGYVHTDGKAASLAFNGIQVLVVSGGKAYCLTLATNALVEVTSQLAGTPVQCDCSDTFFIVTFASSNKFQMSELLDGTTWPGELVNEVSVFADNITSMIVNHRELWIFGEKRSQPYQNSGSANIFDVIEGALLEMGSAATFSVQRLDNSVFWIGRDERGALVAWRSNGYTPQRVSTYAVEVWLSKQANVADLVSYSYQDRGHLFWVLYVPGSDCNWVYDVGEGMWHKRAAWVDDSYQSHWSWNHVYAFGKHLVGDWNTGNLYEMTFDALDDNGSAIRRLRRSPTVANEKNWLYHKELTVDFESGVGPQPPLTDGDGNPRQPQAMLRWSDNRGKTWSNQHVRDCGFAGEYNTRVFWNRLGRSRNRVYELTVSDSISWVITDAYLKVS